MKRQSIKVDEMDIWGEPASVSLFLWKNSGEFFAEVRGVRVEAASLPELREQVKATADKLRRAQAQDFKPVIFLVKWGEEHWSSREEAEREGRKRGGSFGMEFSRAEKAQLDKEHVLLRPFLDANGLADSDIRDDEVGLELSKLSERRRADLEKTRKIRLADRASGKDVSELYLTSERRDRLAKVVAYTDERWNALLFLERMIAGAKGKLDAICDVRTGAKLLDNAVKALESGGHSLALLPAPKSRDVDPKDPHSFVGRKVRFKERYVVHGARGGVRVSFEPEEELEVVGASSNSLRVRSLFKGRGQRKEARAVVGMFEVIS